MTKQTEQGAADPERAAFEAWWIKRQRSRGYGAILQDHVFVRRDEAGHYLTLGLDDALDAWKASASRNSMCV